MVNYPINWVIEFEAKYTNHQVLPGAHRTGREHVTSHVRIIDGEIQTWRTYYKYSSFRIWIFYDETGNI